MQYFNYTEKVVRPYAEADLVASTRIPGQSDRRVARVKPDCKVEWKGAWYDAKVLETEKDRWFIHYVGYEDFWDEWVKQDRIRLTKVATDNK